MAIFPLSPLILTTYYYITTASVTFLVVFKVILYESCGELFLFLAYTVIISKKCIALLPLNQILLKIRGKECKKFIIFKLPNWTKPATILDSVL